MDLDKKRRTKMESKDTAYAVKGLRLIKELVDKDTGEKDRVTVEIKNRWRITFGVGGHKERGNDDIKALIAELQKNIEHKNGVTFNIFAEPPKPEKDLNYPYFYGFIAPRQDPPKGVGGAAAGVVAKKTAKVMEEMTGGK